MLVRNNTASSREKKERINVRLNFQDPSDTFAYILLERADGSRRCGCFVEKNVMYALAFELFNKCSIRNQRKFQRRNTSKYRRTCEGFSASFLSFDLHQTPPKGRSLRIWDTLLGDVYEALAPVEVPVGLEIDGTVLFRTALAAL